MPRPRKILALNNRHFTNAEIAQRQASESAFKSGREKLVPPDFLSSRAKAEFEKIAVEAFWLDNLDLPDLVAYCFYFDRALAIMESDKYIAGEEFHSSSVNLMRKALMDYHKEMRSISCKLGLSAIDRLKLAPPKTEKTKNKFLEGIEDNG